MLPDPGVTDLSPGELRVSKQAVHVGTGSHSVRLGEVMPAGKRTMPAGDWARGARLDAATVLGAHGAGVA